MPEITENPNDATPANGKAVMRRKRDNLPNPERDIPQAGGRGGEIPG
jgi:hypothetical protein